MKWHPKFKNTIFTSSYSLKIEFHPSEKRVKQHLKKIRTYGRRGPGSAIQKIRTKNLGSKKSTKEKYPLEMNQKNTDQKTRSQNLELRSSMAVNSGVQSQNIKWSPKLRKKSSKSGLMPKIRLLDGTKSLAILGKVNI